MIDYKCFKLDNGLIVVLNHTALSSLVTINLMYDVGSKDEHPSKTGLAHLTEHLMFSGTTSVPNFDKIIQKAGGKNNAYTSTDVTCYYEVLPKENLKIGLFLEADRMKNLKISKTDFKVQQAVVIEEFKQRYLNQPYGDVIGLLRDLVYDNHPYNWSTIGKRVEDIEQMTLKDVELFYQTFYTPNNAVLTISGNFNEGEIKADIESYFGNIPSSVVNRSIITPVAKQKKKKIINVERDVPYDAYYMAFVIPSVKSDEYVVAEFLSEILSMSGSGRLYKKLVLDLEFCSEIGVFTTSERYEGMLIVSAMITDDANIDAVAKIIREEIALLANEGFSEVEKTRQINLFQTGLNYSLMSVEKKANILANLKMQGNIELLGTTISRLKSITNEQVKNFINKYLSVSQMNEIYYQIKEKH